jgi:hypothetical protein
MDIRQVLNTYQFKEQIFFVNGRLVAEKRSDKRKPSLTLLLIGYLIKALRGMKHLLIVDY